MPRAPRKAVLVTGAAGYVGSICCESLVQEGLPVIAYDNLSEGHRAAVHPEAVFVRGDVGNRRQLQKVFSQHPIEAVMHFAATAKIDESDPAEFFQNNVSASQVLLDVMLQNGVKKLVFSSSAAVYGEPVEVPIREAHPKSPVNSYGESKWMFERILHWYQRAYGLNSISLRYFNAAGATGRYGEDHRSETHLIPLLFNTALGQLPCFTIYGVDYPTSDGTCIRDFVHVVDIAKAHVLCLKNLGSVGAAAYNVGNGAGFSVKDVLECAQKIIGKPIPTRIGPRRAGDPSVLLADSIAIRRELGWQPLCSDLEAILLSAWRWRRAHPKGYAGPKVRKPKRVVRRRLGDWAQAKE